MYVPNMLYTRELPILSPPLWDASRRGTLSKDKGGLIVPRINLHMYTVHHMNHTCALKHGHLK